MASNYKIYAHAVCHVLFPLADVEVAIDVDEASSPIHVVVSPLALVDL